MEIKGVGENTEIVVNELGAGQSKAFYRFDLIPPEVMLGLAEVYAFGAEKYGDNNWMNLPASDHLNHAMIHIQAHRAGDMSEPHLKHALTRLSFALYLDMQDKQDNKAA